MQPTIGRIVHYKLNIHDAQRLTGKGGNSHQAGDVYPALIVRVWGSTPESAVQLQVFGDCEGSIWATSRTQGDDQGQWSWPTITKES